MLCSSCNNCIFKTPNELSCSLNLLSVIFNDTDQLVAPGLCRLCRDQKWKDRQLNNGILPSLLPEVAKSETLIDYDLIVLFDQERADLNSLDYTMYWCEPHNGQIIIIDLTKPSNRVYKSPIEILNHFKEYGQRNKISYEMPIGQIICGTAVQLASRLIRKPYFLVMEAGASFSNNGDYDTPYHAFKQINHWADRSLLYRISPQSTGVCGLYITATYRALGGDCGDTTFLEKLNAEKNEFVELITDISNTVIYNNTKQ